MKIGMITLTSVALCFAAPCSAAPTRVPAPEFRRFLPQVIGHTTIPILLPSWLPEETTGRWCGGFADPDEYMVWLPDKEEIVDRAPHMAISVVAQRIGPKTPPEVGVPIALAGGQVGYYQASEMAARPSGAWLDFTRNGIRYTVGEYAGIKEDLLHMANSAVTVGDVNAVAPVLRAALPKLRAGGVRPVLLPTYLPPFGKPLPGWQNLMPVMKTDALEDSYLISFSSPKDKYEDTLAIFEADRLDSLDGPLLGAPVSLRMTQAATGAKKLLLRGSYVAADPKDPSTPALIRWDEFGFRYEIRWRGASVTQMVRMAESCVPVTFTETRRVGGVQNAKK